MAEARNQFRVAIGDWSDDGHGRCEYHVISTAKSVEDVREAFFAAREIVPKDLWPETICSNYEEGSVEPDIARRLVLEYDLKSRSDASEEWLDTGFVKEGLISEEILLDIIMAFIEKGDCDLDLKIEPVNYIETLHFYGSDDKGRHIGQMGYGIKSW